MYFNLERERINTSFNRSILRIYGIAEAVEAFWIVFKWL